MLNIIKSFSKNKALWAIAVITVLIGSIITLSGCMSTNTESDLPWNAPQSWEGSVQLPGMSGGGY